MISFSTWTSVGLQLGASENASSFPSYQVPAAVAFAVVQLHGLAHPPATSETVPCIWDSNSFQLSPLMQLFEQLQDALCVLVCVSVCVTVSLLCPNLVQTPKRVNSFLGCLKDYFQILPEQQLVWVLALRQFPQLSHPELPIQQELHHPPLLGLFFLLLS